MLINQWCFLIKSFHNKEFLFKCIVSSFAVRMYVIHFLYTVLLLRSTWIIIIVNKHYVIKILISIKKFSFSFECFHYCSIIDL